MAMKKVVNSIVGYATSVEAAEPSGENLKHDEHEGSSYDHSQIPWSLFDDENAANAERDQFSA